MGDKYWKPLDEMSKEELNEYIAYKWDREEEVPDPTPTPTPNLKDLLKETSPITMPREYVFAGIVGGAILLLSAFPAMILGAIAGVAIALNFGCTRK